MAKKTEIDHTNANDIFLFFRDRLALSKAGLILVENADKYVAEDAINRIEKIPYCSVMSPGRKGIDGARGYEHDYYNPEQLQNWIGSFVSDKGWERCLNNLRQARHKREKQMKGGADRFIKIDTVTFSEISIYAEKAGQTKKEFIAKLMRSYIDQCYADKNK